MIHAWACAKVNLALRVGSHRPDRGLHPLDGLFLSVSWFDRLVIDGAGEDQIPEVGTEIPAGDGNLARRAVEAVASEAKLQSPLRLWLDKVIPVAAGLGGGSADAAAALAAAGRLLAVPRDRLAEMAPALGSDVPFCLTGGFAAVSGIGEIISPLEPPEDFAMAIVVPPAEVSTAEVFARWDDLGEPSGPEIGGGDLPPELRDLAPLRNDLYPAAVEVAQAIEDWRGELARVWDRSVSMSGSGGALFAFFVDEDEADAALDLVPVGARAATPVVPVPFGWVLASDPADPMDSHGRKLARHEGGRWLDRLA